MNDLFRAIRGYLVNILGSLDSAASQVLQANRKIGFAVIFLLGAVIGLGAYTFVYAKGFAYLSGDPEACVNCHAMNQVFQGWMSGDHRHVAGCNDCHLPPGGLRKWYVKGENGFYHSFIFTFFTVPVNIRAREKSRDVIRENCMRCHEGMAYYAIHGPDEWSEALSCLQCHRKVGHAHH